MDYTKFEDEELYRLLLNAIEAQTNNTKYAADAPKVIEEVTKEMKRRNALIKEGEAKATRPTIGLLRTLGYKVGKEGKKKEVRRAVLDYIYNAEILPIVFSLSYMEEWGAQRSKKRYDMIISQISFFIYKNEGLTKYKDLVEAINDWENDRDWFKEKYGQNDPKLF